MTVLQLKKEDLHELLVEFTRSNNLVTSNLLGELKQNQQDLKEVNIGHGAKIDSLIEKVEDVKAQTIRTNGRVTALEKTKWLVAGAITVLGAVSIPNFSILAKLLG